MKQPKFIISHYDLGFIYHTERPRILFETVFDGGGARNSLRIVDNIDDAIDTAQLEAEALEFYNQYVDNDENFPCNCSEELSETY